MMKKVFAHCALMAFATLSLISGAAQAHQRYGPQYYDPALVEAAYRLERASRAMHYAFHHARGGSRLATVAQELARTTRQYRKAVTKGKPPHKVWHKFRQIGDLFRELRHEYRHGYVVDTPDSHRAFHRTVHAFRDLRREARIGHRRGGRAGYAWRYRDLSGWETAGQ